MGVVTTIKRCAEATPHANRTSAENSRARCANLFIVINGRVHKREFRIQNSEYTMPKRASSLILPTPEF
jgi:hypothetical protein